MNPLSCEINVRLREFMADRQYALLNVSAGIGQHCLKTG
jgi:hypothetical protein